MCKCVRRGVIAAIAVAVIFGFGLNMSWADDAEIQQLKAQMNAMNQTIQQLQQTIQQMQGVIQKYERQTAARPQPVAPATAASQVEEVKNEFLTLKEAVDKFITITGYYSFEYADDDRAGSPGAFAQHSLSLFLDKRLDKFHVFSELEFEYGTSIAGSGSTVTGSGEVNVENAWAEYNYNDVLNIRGGKYFVPNYWIVHHYPSITVSTSDPKIVESAFFPPSNTGVEAYGNYYFPNEWGLGYNLFVGNGEGPDPAKSDVTDDKAWGGKLTAHIPFFDRFDVAAISYIGENASRELRQLWGGETQITAGDFELLGEIAHGSREGAFGYYVQPSYRFRPKWTAFYRLDSEDDNNKIDDPNDALRHTFGLRYQPIPAVSLKGEIYRELPRDTTRERFNGFLSSIAVFF